ncbi:PREDICTED: uncharacterized protein LOC109164918 isoform X2 [Ipomoea nil]|uniref:uncharacterized protein LOC109164918 isoform X2 n=1 Tax=Ipomoea nil TaxID=35883 RepID=UPI0009013B52|nr:PREDICTED: uncharacterized protein LOC109164918 isoform X2 [Ipomoea nil]
MSSESKPVIGSLPAGISSWKPPATGGTSTVGQLLDIWKYLSREKEIPPLSERESGARREQSRLEIENVKLKVELKNLRREYENLTENNIRLEEEKKVLDGREKRSEERYKKINQELLKEQEEKCKLIFSLKKEIETLKSEKNEAAMKLEASEKRFQLLEERHSCLEKYVAVKEGKMAENHYGDADNGTHLASTPDTMGSCRSKLKDASSFIVASPVVVLSDSDEGASLAYLCSSEVLGQTEKSSSTHKSQEKKEKRVVKRKRSLRKSHDGGVSPWKKMYVQDLQDHRVSSRSCSRGDGSKGGADCAVAPSKGGSSMDSEDSATYLGSQKGKGRGPWLLEPDMRLAFEDDPELCMDAVCALYRLQLSLPLSLKRLDKELEIVRVAKYLIHDDPENKLKRSVREVSKDVVVECKRLALHHSGELFRVYCSGKDPFFCYTAICSMF